MAHWHSVCCDMHDHKCHTSYSCSKYQWIHYKAHQNSSNHLESKKFTNSYVDSFECVQLGTQWEFNRYQNTIILHVAHHNTIKQTKKKHTQKKFRKSQSYGNSTFENWKRISCEQVVKVISFICKYLWSIPLQTPHVQWSLSANSFATVLLKFIHFMTFIALLRDSMYIEQFNTKSVVNFFFPFSFRTIISNRIWTIYVMQQTPTYHMNTTIFYWNACIFGVYRLARALFQIATESTTTGILTVTEPTTNQATAYATKWLLHSW